MSSSFLADLFYLPKFSKGVFHVWMRNFLVFKYMIWATAIWVFVEPLLYLLAIGYGIGSMVESVNGEPYIKFFFPAFMVTSGMLISYFETTYSSFTKLQHQNTFQTILMTPVSAVDIALGEIAWATTKGFLSCLAVTVVAASQGLIETWLILPALGFALINNWIFASLGLLMTSFAKNYEWFMYSQTGLVIPMSLFTGTYFPLEYLPDALEKISYMLPLTHTVMATRSLIYGNINSELFMSLGVLFAFAFFITNLAVSRLERKIVY